MLMLFGLLALPVIAQVSTNLPGGGVVTPLPSTKAEYWDLAIGAISPIIIWVLAWLMPKIPKPLLPTLTPLVGIGLGLLVNWLAGQSLSWFEAAKAGALAVFFRELVNQWVTKRLTEPTTPTPAPSPPAA